MKNLTSKESFDILREIESKKCPDGVRYSKWREERDRQQTEAIRNLVPEIGLGCTICYYSDMRAATVTKIISPCKIEVTFNQVKCIDYYAGQYEILKELEGAPKVFTKRRNRRWVADGQSCKDGVLYHTMGGTDSTVVDARILFAGALTAKATGMILCHNHPSGKIYPSVQDDNLTRKLVDGAKLLDMQILDHIILTSDNYFSYADEGRL